MISYNLHINGVAKPCPKEKFYELIADKDGTLAARCKKYHDLKILLKQRKDAGDAEGKKKVEELIKPLKEQQPGVCYLGTFKGNHRTKSNAQWNGLCYIDIDLEGNEEQLKEGPRVLDKRIHDAAPEFYDQQIVLAHVSWSDTGLRYIFKADHSMTYMENIYAFCDRYGLIFDSSCTDLSRASYAVPESYIIKLEDELFTYDNPMKNSEFGGDDDDTETCLWFGMKRDEGKEANDSTSTTSTTVASTSVSTTPQKASVYTTMKNVERNGDGEPCCMGVPYKDIALRLMEKLGGIPREGMRNSRLSKWAWHFRSVCDDDVEFMFDMVRPMIDASFPDKEIRDTIHSAVKKNSGIRMTKQMQQVMQEMLGKDCWNESEFALDDSLLDMDYWNRRLNEIHFPKGLKESIEGVPVQLRPGITMAVLPVIGALASRCSAFFNNGDMIGLSGVTIWVGESTVGKRHLNKVCEYWYDMLEKEDEEELAKAQAWDEERARKGSNKDMPEKRPKPLVRVIPSIVSKSQLEELFANAHVMVPSTTKNGDGPLVDTPLRLITVESDMGMMESSLKRDFSDYMSYIIKSFDSEMAGKFYMNREGRNGRRRVLWNFVGAGTWPTFWNIINKNIRLGLEYRLMIFPVASQHFQKEEISAFATHPKWVQTIKSVAKQIGGKDTLLHGPIYCPELIKEMEKWCDEQGEIAKEEKDTDLRDVFRRRDRQKGFIAGILFSLIEQKDKFAKLQRVKMPNGEIGVRIKPTKNALLFARFIADFCVECEMAVLGDVILEAKMNSKGAPLPSALALTSRMKRTTKDMFNRLSPCFTIKEFKKLFPEGTSINTIKGMLQGWRDKYVRYNQQKECYEKLVESL